MNLGDVLEIFGAGHRDPPIGGHFFSTLWCSLFLGGIFAAILDLDTDQIGPEIVYFIAYVWLSIALGVRRLHDIGRKGTWLLLGLVPFGNLVLLYWLVQPSSVETNEWGDSGAQGEITTARSDTEPEPPQQTSDIIR